MKRPGFVVPFRLLGLALVASATLIAGCNSGSSSLPVSFTGTASPTATPTITASPTPSPAPTASPAPGPTSAATTVPLATGTAIPLPSIAGITGSITFASGGTIPSGTTISVTVANFQPSPPPAYAAPSPTASPSGTGTPLLYATITFSNNVTLSAGPAQSFTLPGSTTGHSYYTYFQDATAGTNQGYGNAGTVSGSTVTFPGGGGGAQTLLTGHVYYQTLFQF